MNSIAEFGAERLRFFRARRGMGIVECIILLIVLGLSLAAVMSAMGWGSRSYTFAREDLDQHLLLFDWFQTFESFYPGVTDDVADACGRVTEFLGGSWNTASRQGSFREGRIQVREVANADGILRLNVKVFRNRGGASAFELERRFNVFSSETVSDDVLHRGA